MNLGPPASLPAWQSARNTPAGMPAVPTTPRFMGGEQVRKEHGASHEPHPCPPLGALEERVPEGRAFAEATAPQAVWKPPLPRSLW